MDFSKFDSLPLLAILRGLPGAAIPGLADMAARSGLTALEVTMNTEDAVPKIAALSEAAAGRFLVGAGTVLTRTDLDEALAAGASFIVMPTLEPAVVRVCVDRGIPVIPGALTPQEVRAAQVAGATLVKLFPASVFGPRYVKELLGPFSDLRLLACGGVDRDTLPAYFDAGVAAVAVGASVFRPDWLRESQFDAVEARLKPLVDACKEALSLRGGAPAS